MENFGTVALGKISNVRTVNGNTSVYYCYVEMVEEGFEPEVAQYVASRTDVAVTGKWVYQQIVNGNIEGEIVDVSETVDPFTGEERPDTSAQDARRERDKRLATTDWTQNADITQATKDKWAPYRQALRDISQQAGFPHNIVWPTPPQ
jgi:hypothetical protein